MGSVFVPGLGQYLYGATLPGFAFTAAAVAGYGLSETGDAATPVDELPRDGRDQLAYEGIHLAFTAGTLSAYDVFRRALPALQWEGKYRFIEADDDVGALLTAPFDMRFLARWTTWVDLGYTFLVTGLVLSTRDDGVTYEPFRAHDAAFITALSLNAGVGEEAMFRGWLLPLLHQNVGRRFWLANGIQSAIFGSLHVPQAEGFAIVIGAWALYEGWLTRRNGWSVRESIFHHFWYDVFVGVATLLADEQGTMRFTAPTIRF